MQCWRYKIIGVVQGVFYRRSVFEAVELRFPDIAGHVKNMPDGSVEVLGIGSVDDLNKLQACLYTGSPVSRVDKIEVEKLEDIPTGYDTFYIKN